MNHRYEDRIRRVLQYIHDNPDGDLSLDTLAGVAAMSRFHWHRVFHGMTGETLAHAVRRIRAHRAAGWLTTTDCPLDEIAARAGYAGAESFSRGFRDIYGMTPASYRKLGNPGAVQLLLREKGHAMHPVEKRDQPELRLASLPHRGAYMQIGRVFDQLSAVFSARGLWPQARGMAAVYYDDPGATPEAELTSAAGIVLDAQAAMPEGLSELRIAGGLHAVLRFTGPYAELHTAYDYLYGEWLPAAGHETADSPPYELYLNSPADVPPAELVTEICAPLRSAEQDRGQ